MNCYIIFLKLCFAFAISVLAVRFSFGIDFFTKMQWIVFMIAIAGSILMSAVTFIFDEE
jgi:hypothetical protein